MVVIWKFQLEITDRQDVEMPVGSEILYAGNQHEQLCLWVMCDGTYPKKSRLIEIVGTGHPIKPQRNHRRHFIGTVIIDPFVWHVFEIEEIK